MAKKDYYDLLGVSKSATDKEIKSAFRQKAKKLHPDQNQGNPNAEKEFKEINEAYEVLKDSDKRAAYDQYGHAAFEGGMGGGHHGGGHPGGAGFGNFGDIFEDIFTDFMGGSRSSRRSSGAARGADMRYDMQITLEEAFEGKTASIKIPTTEKCSSCNGTGSADKKEPQTCGTCHGRGSVRAQSGFFTIERTCPICGGEGKIIKNPCRVCNGTGQEAKNKMIDVTIPAGVDSGNRLLVSGQGAAGARGGPKGDLYVFVEVKDHPIFERSESDLHCRVPVSFVGATLGTKIDVPTIDGGKARVTIPSGAQTGKQFRLRDKGMPYLRNKRHGDLYIEIFVETPTNLTEKQKELLQEFDTESAHNYQDRDGFFSKVKDIFGWSS